MSVMLIQCFGHMNLARCHAAQNADIPQPCDAQLAMLVGDVALCLDVRGFVRGAAQIAQLVEPCDALLAVLVDVAPSLDVRGFTARSVSQGSTSWAIWPKTRGTHDDGQEGVTSAEAEGREEGATATSSKEKKEEKGKSE